MTENLGTTKMNYYAAIEAGGTKFNCALIRDDQHIVKQTRIATTTPEQTLNQVVDFFQPLQAQYTIESLGLACFGPICLDKQAENYGGITTTPKPHWANTPISRQLSKRLNLPVFFDSDVNGAALGEYLWGAAQQTNVAVYVTIGTGLGGGIIVNGQILHGLHHPEMGHMLIPSSVEQGHCPFHGGCLEGLASGTSMGKLWQQPTQTLDDTHEAWQLQADHVASFCHNLLVTLAPEKIILGGGVMQKSSLLTMIIEATQTKLANYLNLGRPMQEIIVEPALDQASGLLGALALAQGKGRHGIGLK
ncbi:fructokinase (plasmid) [Saccharobesus litoralis]|uniref:fructokinase n=1 Tax=Saccharobesus litoralis TaxID=2172099 RepID=A0A2S0VYG9_9ALTE|nr:ROK family protein [Saccharobesus litoralis]AWB69251.1 fructokinase [Saccharobesus litoralis]